MIPLVMTIVGFVRGIHEGMIHIRLSECMHSKLFDEGVRGHVWHPYYHIIAGIRDLLFISLGIYFAIMDYSTWDIVAGLILMWETTEIGYAYARVERVVMSDRGKPYERLVLGDILPDIVLRGSVVYVLHAARIITGVVALMK